MNNGTWEKRLLTHSLPLQQKPGRKSVNLELQLWRENLSVAISWTEGSNLNCRDFLASFQANFLKDDYKSFVCLKTRHTQKWKSSSELPFPSCLCCGRITTIGYWKEWSTGISIRNPKAFQSCQGNFHHHLFLHCYKYVTAHLQTSSSADSQRSKLPSVTDLHQPTRGVRTAH